MADWQKIGLEVLLHFAMIHFLIVFARHTKWFLFIVCAGIVTFGMLFILLTIPTIQASDLTKVTGIYDHTKQESSESLTLKLQNDNREFEVTDLEYFSSERFRKDIKQGDAITLTILTKFQNELKSGIVVFEVLANNQEYLSKKSILESRQHDNKVTIPNILMCSGILLALSVAASRTERHAYEIAAGGFAAALLLIALNFILKKNGLVSVTSTLSLPFLYPIVLITERRFRDFDRVDWIIAGANYTIVVLAAIFSFELNSK